MLNRSSYRFRRSSPWAASALFLTAGILLLPTPARANGEVQPSICRGAGFWGTHAGDEKTGTNIVAALLEEAGGCLEVCGEMIRTTEVDDADSAEEALCISPKAPSQIQLARQLTAAALNCVLSTGEADCDPQWSQWLDCNEACRLGDTKQLPFCRAYLDCRNNGGTWDPGAQACVTGTCSYGGQPCGPLIGCAAGEWCEPTIGCDDAALVNEALGLDFTGEEELASSSKQCSRATRTPCTVVGPNEARCADGKIQEMWESCSCDGVFCGWVCLEHDNCLAACEAFDGCNPDVACDDPWPTICQTTCQAGAFGTVCDPVTHQGDCCTKHDNAGCSNPTCEAAVCLIDASCCTYDWDLVCADEAVDDCPGLCGDASCVDCDFACFDDVFCEAACAAAPGCVVSEACAGSDQCETACSDGEFGTVCAEDWGCFSAWVTYCDLSTSTEGDFWSCVGDYLQEVAYGFCEACEADPSGCV